jgi:hypothetical protein
MMRKILDAISKAEEEFLHIWWECLREIRDFMRDEGIIPPRNIEFWFYALVVSTTWFVLLLFMKALGIQK